MQVTIFGWNYEGAHFRGLPSPTDETFLKVTLTGTEQEIAQAITREFAYGDEVKTFQDVIDGYANLTIPNGDGCGGVVRILDEHGDVVWEDEEASVLELGTPLELGRVPAADLNLNALVRRFWR